MSRERLQLALEKLQFDQWKVFEEFASSFLASEYPNLRTVASPSGDEGRDAELFSYDGRVPTVLQYSVAKDWREKIRKTARRISGQKPDTTVMIYVTNRSILGSADSLKTELRNDYALILDVHDRDWFLDRFAGDEHRESVSEELAKKIVDPFLARREILTQSTPTLTSEELRVALTFLQLQWEDDTREKGLTKLSYEALARMILRDTNSYSRLPRATIHERMIQMFPSHNPERLVTHIDSALGRLTKRKIRHWTKEDEFCLTHEEHLRVRDQLSKIAVRNSELDNKIRNIILKYLDNVSDLEGLVELVRQTINHHFLEVGDAFAGAITGNGRMQIDVDDLYQTSTAVVGRAIGEAAREEEEKLCQIISESVRELLTEPTGVAQEHLRARADSYTLFAFLGRTPDIQRAVSKMFSHGSIWLDTTILLPLLAEDLIAEGSRRFSQMIMAASGAGLKLCVTPGVLEEVERHINRCVVFVSIGRSAWSGGVPFLADAYIRSGRGLMSFSLWIETFQGNERPEDDLADYFGEYFSIHRVSLEAEERKAPDGFRMAAERAWYEAHSERRRHDDRDMDEISFARLVRHDVENYVGVVALRRSEEISPLGYSAWWLTLDRLTRQVEASIVEELGHDAPSSPVMSADFLVNYLTVGPVRGKVGRGFEAPLPFLVDVDVADELPEELISEAERIREESAGVSEHIIRRRVRDSLDRAKRRRGHVTAEGIGAVLNRISPE